MSLRKTAAFTVSLVVAGSLAGATVYFEDTGTKTGWSNYPQQPQNKGTIDEVTSPRWGSSGTALKFTQIYDPVYSQNSNYTAGYHAEVVKFGAQSVGTDRYYGATVLLPANWLYHDSNDTFQQFSPENPSGPWALHWIQKDHIWLRIPAGHQDLGVIPIGVWIRQVVRFKLGNPGTFEYWLNGTKTKSVVNTDLDPNGSATIRWSVGIYCTAWRNHIPPDGDIFNQTTRTIYQDQFRISSSYTESEPANWGASPTPTPTPVSTPSPTPTPAARPTPTPAATPTPTPVSTISGYYKILARHSGKAVVVQGASTSNSANVVQWTYGGTATNDEWEVRSIGSGYYRVINRNSGKDLTVQSASTSDGANIFQYTYGGTATNDEWAVVSVGSGYYRITSRNSGKSTEVAAGSTTDGANVDQRTYGGATYQQFQLVSVP
jgi:predicted nucleic acid-binding Zn ribbon protein